MRLNMKKWIVAASCAVMLAPAAKLLAQEDPGFEGGGDFGAVDGGGDFGGGGGFGGDMGGFGGGGDFAGGGDFGGGRGGRGAGGGGGRGGRGGGNNNNMTGNGGGRGNNTTGGRTRNNTTGGMNDPNYAGRDTFGGTTNNMRRTTSAMQYQLNSPDDEWIVIEPKVMRVEDMQASMQTSTRGYTYANYGGGRGGRGGGGPTAVSPTDPNASASDGLSAVQRAMNALVDALADPQSNDGQLAQRLKELRKARADAKKELETAQKELQAFMTLRQEAVLIGLGLLD
jgi:hypothetical protein